MKKFLLLFIPILTFTFLFTTNKTHAQEYPQVLMKHSYALAAQVGQYSNTYVYLVDYRFEGVKFTSLGENEYFLVPNYNIPMQKGLNEFWNSYELIAINDEVYENDTIVQLRVTLLKDLADSYNDYPVKTIQDFFRNDSALYVIYTTGTGSQDYENGYNDGYNDGYNVGRDDGYDEGYLYGYDDGYNDARIPSFNEGYDLGYSFGYDDGYIVGEQAGYNNGYNVGKQDGYDEAFEKYNKSFVLKVDVWLVPAIIVVFAIGIFITYRKERV